MKVNFLCLKEKFEARIDPEVFPPGAAEVLWVHPSGLEMQEVRALIKNKQTLRLLYTPVGGTGDERGAEAAKPENEDTRTAMIQHV